MSPTDRYRRIAQIVDEAYTAYEEGLIALRRRVVDDVRRKLSEGGVIDRPRERSMPRSAPRRRRR